MQKKLRGKKITTQSEYARVFQFLMRQGFSPATVTAVLRSVRRGGHDE
jgi:SOS response regulatory protein OraA/RecX